MREEVITSKQGIIMVTMFLLGSSLILGSATEAKQDAWLAILIAIAAAMPVIFVYGKLLSMYPGKDLYSIVEELFGPILGKIITAVYIFYFVHLGALVLKNFSSFIKIIGLKETPDVMTVMFMGVLCIWAVKEGVELLGRWMQFVFPIVAFTIIFLLSFSFQGVDISNLKPFMYNGFYPVFKGAFFAFSFPFAETIAFLMLLNHLKEPKKSYKTLTIGLLIGGMIILLLSVRNLMVMGPEYADSINFGAYEAVSLIQIGNFLQRFEVFVSVVFLFTGFAKISICMHSASKGVEKLFNLKDYKRIVAPVGLLTMIISCFLFDNYSSLIEWGASVYSYYALPFQVIIPIITLLTAVVKTKIMKKNGNTEQLPQSN
jgi:spore germination protein KB